VLAGAVGVITLTGDPGGLLRDLCVSSEVPLHDGPALVPELDPGSPEHVARLVRVALDADA
jgi:hypothetical protein